MEELYKHTQTKTCPTCREPLPPGAEKMHEEAVLRYWAVKKQVEREAGLSWSALPSGLQKEMDEAKLRGALRPLGAVSCVRRFEAASVDDTMVDTLTAG